MPRNTLILAGTLPQHANPLPPFAPIVLNFFQALSEELRRPEWLHKDPAWFALGFWLRKKHIESFSPYLTLPEKRLGRGIVFHITPTNMPTMFFYSFAISLLAGNNNIVRLSPQLVQTAQPLLDLVQSLWQQKPFQSLSETNIFLSYERQKELTDIYSQHCDVRLIWGGNTTIQDIRTSPLPPQSLELVFADRYSLAIFDAATILGFSQDELRNWIHRFYLDSYEADQNACSSPKLICWISPTNMIANQAQRRWWQTLLTETESYDLAPIKVSKKYTDAWSFSMKHPEISTCIRLKNDIYVYTLHELPTDLTALSGIFGQFFQITLPSVELLIPYLSKKIQTISTIGISPIQIRKALQRHHVLGVDRIVPTGQALTMDVIWDGTNLLDYLSRIIS